MNKRLSPSKTATSRRDFIRATAAIAGGAALLPLTIAAPKPTADFLILPEGVPAPEMANSPPKACSHCRCTSFNSAEELARQLPFSLYGMTQNSPLAFREASAYVGKRNRIQSATLVYGCDQYTDIRRDWTLSITASRNFRRPYILWNEQGSETVFTSDFLPRLGIVTTSRCGAFFRWIEKRTLFQVQTHSALSMEQARELTASLRRIG